jgi:hypothetical protein
MKSEQIEVPKRQQVQSLEGHHRITYGADVIFKNPTMACALGAVVAYIADAERHLEAVFRSLVGGRPRAISVVLANFRGHKQLLAAIAACLEETGEHELLETFRAIRQPIHDAWTMRDELAHGVWADCDLFPQSALRLSPRLLGRAETAAKEMLNSGDFEGAFDSLTNVDAEIWTEADFIQAREVGRGVVNSLIAFSACISQPLPEAAWLHTAPRSQGLLSAPPWTLRSSTPPQETADKLERQPTQLPRPLPPSRG